MKRFTIVFILLFCATMSSSFVLAGVPDVQRKQFVLSENKMDKEVDSKDWYYKGLALKNQGEKLQEAVDAFTKSIDLDPNYLPCYYERAYLYEKMGKWEKALQDYNKMLELDPYFRVAYFNRGRACKHIAKSYSGFRNYGIKCRTSWKLLCSSNSTNGRSRKKSGHLYCSIS